jgi:cyanophycin synthetase
LLSRNHLHDQEEEHRIVRVTHLRGPNIWTYRPVIEAWSISANWKTSLEHLPGLYERLTACCPADRAPLRRGRAWRLFRAPARRHVAGHILEHVVLELQNLAGMRTASARRSTSQRGVYKMAFRTREEHVGRAARRAATC